MKKMLLILSIFILPFYAFANTFDKSKCDFTETNVDVIKGIINGGKIYKNDKTNGILCYSEKKADTIIPVKNGMPNGTGYTFYKNGGIKWETPYINGKIEGIEKGYYENGSLKSETPYKNGKIDGQEKLYDKNGKLKK